MNLLKEISANKKIKNPVIYGFSGKALTDQEKYFFSKSGPIGFIVFARNIEDKSQLKSLTNSLKELMEGEVLILVDQEGGRVARMTEPQWKKYPAGQHFADLYLQNPEQAREAIYKNFQEIADDLIEVGINVDCAPVLDILTEKTHQVIGNRAYGNNAALRQVLHGHPCRSSSCGHLVRHERAQPVHIRRILFGLHHARQRLDAGVSPPQCCLTVGREAVGAVDQQKCQLVRAAGMAGTPPQFQQGHPGMGRHRGLGRLGNQRGRWGCWISHGAAESGSSWGRPR